MSILQKGLGGYANIGLRRGMARTIAKVPSNFLLYKSVDIGLVSAVPDIYYTGMKCLPMF